MKQNPDELEHQIEALQQRVSTLCAAVLRISASLDLDTVLHEVVESARALTGARYGAITTVDEAGQPQEFIASGITPDEHRQLLEWSEGLRLFEHLKNLPGALRVADLPGYLRSLGFATDLLPYKTLQGTPMRHRSVQVGSFYLAEKEGGREFTGEDEEPPRAIRLAGGVGDRQCPPPTGTSSGSGRTWRPWSTRRRSGWRSSTRRPAISCRSTGRRSGSSRTCACRAAPRSSCWRS